jgi:hypothetical protein
VESQAHSGIRSPWRGAGGAGGGGLRPQETTEKFGYLLNLRGCIRGPFGLVEEKKTEIKIGCNCPFNYIFKIAIVQL